MEQNPWAHGMRRRCRPACEVEARRGGRVAHDGAKPGLCGELRLGFEVVLHDLAQSCKVDGEAVG
jgi:hypothetical protein